METKKAAATGLLSAVEGAPLPFVRAGRHGDVILDIQVIPNAAKTQIDGLYGEGDQVALKVRLNAPPVDGKANEALIRWLASELGIARNSLQVVRGHTSRRKQLSLTTEAAAGAKWTQLTDRLDSLAGKPLT